MHCGERVLSQETGLQTGLYSGSFQIAQKIKWGLSVKSVKCKIVPHFAGDPLEPS